MNKRILYISYDGMTDPLGQSQVLPYLTGLSKLGYEFTLLSFEKKQRFAKGEELIRKICAENNIRWVPEFFSTRPPLLSKLWDSWKMKRKVQALHREHRFHFTHCRSYVAAAAGLHLWQKEKVPFLFDMRGFWVDERVDNGQWNLSNPLYKTAYRLYKKKEKKYLQGAAAIISLTHKGKEELVANYQVSPAKVAVIPCCADLAHFDYKRVTEQEKQEIRRKLGIIPEQPVLSYLGSLGGWYLTNEMLDFFRVVKQQHPQAKFLFITHDKKEDIVAKAVARGIAPESILAEPATRKEVPLYLAVSSWSVFFIRDAYSKKASSPTKQGEIMAMGIPIVCNDIGDTGKIIEESATGYVVRTFNDEGYHSAAAQLASLSALDKEKIRKAAFDYYDLTAGVQSYHAVYKQF